MIATSNVVSQNELVRKNPIGTRFLHWETFLDSTGNWCNTPPSVCHTATVEHGTRMTWVVKKRGFRPTCVHGAL